MTCLWIATTPRSGSNFFCDLLYERAQIQIPKEFLNPMFLRKHDLVDSESRFLMPSLGSLLDHIGRQWHNTEQPLCLKALYTQFDAARTLPGIQESLTANAVVMLVRLDIVAQAVSLYVAMATGQWISSAQSRRDLETLPYDFDAVERAVERIERHNALWRRTFMVCGINYKEIAYEQLRLEPAETVDAVVELWGLTPRPQPRRLREPHRSQTTDLNARFIERYRHDKAKAIFETATPKERT